MKKTQQMAANANNLKSLQIFNNYTVLSCSEFYMGGISNKIG